MNNRWQRFDETFDRIACYIIWTVAIALLMILFWQVLRMTGLDKPFRHHSSVSVSGPASASTREHSKGAGGRPSTAPSWTAQLPAAPKPISFSSTMPIANRTVGPFLPEESIAYLKGSQNTNA